MKSLTSQYKTANAFVGTFAFLQSHNPTKKSKRAFTRSANTNIVQLIKFGAYRQFSVPKPPLLLAANRWQPWQVRHNDDILF